MVFAFPPLMEQDRRHGSTVRGSRTLALREERLGAVRGGPTDGQGRPQITCHLHVTERAAFADYSRSFGLDPPSLMLLLFARERRVGRLQALIRDDKPHPGPRKGALTVHKKDPTMRKAVATMAAQHGTTASGLFGVLIRAELAERWLDVSLGTRFESR